MFYRSVLPDPSPPIDLSSQDSILGHAIQQCHHHPNIVSTITAIKLMLFTVFKVWLCEGFIIYPIITYCKTLRYHIYTVYFIAGKGNFYMINLTKKLCNIWAKKSELAVTQGGPDFGHCIQGALCIWVRTKAGPAVFTIVYMCTNNCVQTCTFMYMCMYAHTLVRTIV